MEINLIFVIITNKIIAFNIDLLLILLLGVYDKSDYIIIRMSIYNFVLLKLIHFHTKYEK